MYGIFISYPRYDNRDAFVGYSVERFHANAYETSACAWAYIPRHLDHEAGGSEVEFSVRDLADPFRRPVPPPFSWRRVEADDDIPF